MSESVSQHVAYFAKTDFRNEARVFGIKPDDRRRHVYIIGKTGMGKTNLLENLVIQDIQRGAGVAYIDPHGDTAEKLIRAIPANRINDVIYFNPSDQEYPVAFNVMERVAPEYRHLVASGLVGVFKKIWADSWGPRLEYILRNAILALLEYPGSTLLGVMRLLVDKEYRKRVVDRVTDPVVKSFWVDEFTKWNDRVLQEVIAPIQNKVGQFLSSSLIRNIVGQTTSSFDVRDIMDSRKILIMNLSKGRIGEDNSALIGAMMITKIQLAAMGRVDMAEDERQDFYLYVDEFQNFATESFANILSEARKYRLNLILANQYILQIEESVRNAIFGNAGTIISFRVGAGDAEALEKEFSPVFLANDIVNLPKYHIYLKLMIDGIAGDAFSAETLPPIELPEGIDQSEKVMRVSRERYAAKKQDVEDKIRRWTGMLTEEERQSFEERMRARMTEAIESAPENLRSRSNVGSATPRTPLLSSTPMLMHSTRSASESDRFSQKSVRGGDVARDDIRSREMRGASESVSERQRYKAVCAVCGIDIEVPFKPDGKRPTFCPEHFRQFQRTFSEAQIQQNESNRKEMSLYEQDSRNRKTDPSSEMVMQQTSQVERIRPREIYASNEGHRTPEMLKPRAFVSKDPPLSLGQMRHIAPKAFRHSRPNVDLGEVRGILHKERPRGQE